MSPCARQKIKSRGYRKLKMIDQQQEDKILKEIALHWGLEAQINQSIEECAEFIMTVRHYYRGKCELKDLVSEMVDVELMMKQMKIFMPKELWESEREFKLSRVQKVLEGEVKKDELQA